MSNSHEHLLGGVIILTALIIISSVVWLIALLLWLAQFLGSTIAALVIVGGVSMLLALMLYLCSVRPQMKRVRHELATIYEVAELLQEICRRAVCSIKAILHM